MDFVSKGLYHYSNQDYRQALRRFHTAAMIDSTFPEVNLNIGACYIRLGMIDSAYHYLNREQRLNPQRPKSYTNLASLYLLNGEYELSIEKAKQALAIAPYDVTANMVFLRAVAHNPAVGNDSLSSLVSKAAANTADDIYLLNDAAAILTQRNATEMARTVLRQALNSKPEPVETDDQVFERCYRNSPQHRRQQRSRTHYQLGYLAGLNGRYPEAVEHSRLAIAYDSNLIEAYVNLVSGYRSAGQPDKADSVLSIATKKFPDNPYIRRLLSYP